MKLQPRIYATLCAVLISTPAFAAQISLPTTLDQLLPDGDLAVVGDLTFDLFTYTSSGADMPIPEQINVVAAASNTGIRFTGPFLDLPAGIGNGASIATLGYTMTSTVGINRVMLSGNPSLLGGSGSASVTQTFVGFPTIKLDIHDDPSIPMPVIVETSADLGRTVTSLTVMQGITLRTEDPNLSATLQLTNQEFVPEPTGFMLALVGFVGIGALRRRRQR